MDDPRYEVEGRIFRKLILFLALSFIVLPFMTTFNETLTKIVEGIHLVRIIQNLAAPFTVRIVATILRILGIPCVIDSSSLYLTGGWMPLEIYISWNCIGWQSFILLVLTFVTGLQGQYTRRSKLLTVLLGLEGTFIVNILRILIPTLLAHSSGYVSAIIFHDYIGTILMMLWIGAFWSYSFRNILEPRDTPAVNDLKQDKVIMPLGVHNERYREGS
jgi:exosortase/archaeosortase family protein